MSNRTTIAEMLGHVFAQLEKTMPQTPNTGKSLLIAWREVLGAPGGDQFTVVENLGLVSSALRRLEAQINSSQKLRAASKRSALQTVDQFKNLFSLNHFHHDAFSYRANCSEQNRGNLEIIGHSLESEFSEPKLQKADADEIAETLGKVKEELAISTVPLDLRLSLTKHIDVMIWWLTHPDMASMQDVFEILGSVIIVGKQIQDRDPERESTEPSSSKTIWSYLTRIAAKMGQLMDMTARGVETMDKLSSATQHLLEGLNPPS